MAESERPFAEMSIGFVVHCELNFLDPDISMTPHLSFKPGGLMTRNRLD